jgi:MFS family permease
VLSVGTAVYPVLGGALATLAWYAPFLLAFLAVPVGLLVLIVLRTPALGTPEPLLRYLRTAGRLMWRREVLGLFSAGFVIFIFLYGAYLTYLPFVLQERFAATPLAIGGVFAAASISTAVASFNLGRLARATGERALVRIGFAAYATTLALMPLVPSVWMLLLVVGGFGAAGGIAIPSILTLIAGASPAAYRAAFLSVNGTLLRLGQTLGPLVGAAAFTAGGLRLTFWLASGLGAAMFLVLMVVLGRGKGGEVAA